MSLGAIRELIPRLEADGLIRTVPQRGMQVAQVDVSLIRNAFQFRLMHRARGRGAVRAERAPTSEFDRLQQAHEAVLAAAAKAVTPALIARAQAVDDGMHATIVDALGNDIVSNTYRVNSLKIRLIRQSRRASTPTLVVPVMRGAPRGDRRAAHRAIRRARRRRWPTTSTAAREPRARAVARVARREAGVGTHFPSRACSARAATAIHRARPPARTRGTGGSDETYVVAVLAVGGAVRAAGARRSR